MTSSHPLKGIALIDCAKANAAQGTRVASQQCGYAEDIDAFLQALREAGKETGITITEITDLVSPSDQPHNL